MCTLLTIRRDQFNAQIEERIWQDAAYNDDGWSLILVNVAGEYSVLRTLDFFLIIQTLKHADWERMFLHARMATMGGKSVDNTHGWSEGGVFYMHNGVLKDPASWDYDVDSQLIGEWLRQDGVEGAIQRLAGESFANVFMIDSKLGYYAVVKSTTGSLYTDGEGGYSTNPVGPLQQAVRGFSYDFHTTASVFDTSKKGVSA